MTGRLAYQDYRHLPDQEPFHQKSVINQDQYISSASRRGLDFVNSVANPPVDSLTIRPRLNKDDINIHAESNSVEQPRVSIPLVLYST